MGKFYDEIPDFLEKWIKQQKMFWVATAPLSPTGHVNVSPKGYNGTFHIVNKSKVWYEDLTGSGIESTAHLRENGRMTILFCAFEGPPRILRLFCSGTVYEFDTPDYNALIPVKNRYPGSRSVIMLDVHKVGTSCGFSIPFYTYKSDRTLLNKLAWSMELAERVSGLGHKAFWKKYNETSIDGLPGLLTAFSSQTTCRSGSAVSQDGGEQDLTVSAGTDTKKTTRTFEPFGLTQFVDAKLLAGFVLGIVASGLWVNLLREGLGTKFL